MVLESVLSHCIGSWREHENFIRLHQVPEHDMNLFPHDSWVSPKGYH